MSHAYISTHFQGWVLTSIGSIMIEKPCIIFVRERKDLVCEYILNLHVIVKHYDQQGISRIDGSDAWGIRHRIKVACDRFSNQTKNHSSVNSLSTRGLSRINKYWRPPSLSQINTSSKRYLFRLHNVIIWNSNHSQTWSWVGFRLSMCFPSLLLLVST
jgi:hypothetical protein